MDALAFAQIEHFGSVVANRADEQSFARSVEVEVIDPSFYSSQRDRLPELEPRATRFSADEMIASYREDDGSRNPGQRCKE
jgi:hypothetical protein